VLKLASPEFKHSSWLCRRRDRTRPSSACPVAALYRIAASRLYEAALHCMAQLPTVHREHQADRHEDDSSCGSSASRIPVRGA
jgi:hypothetical protein